METYNGRLVSVDGNLVAFEARKVGERTVIVHDEDGAPVLDSEGNEIELRVPVMKFGKDHGRQVKAASSGDKTSYVFVEDGEPGHFDAYHERFAGVVMTHTDDPTVEGYAGTPDNPTWGNEHHFDQAVRAEEHHPKLATKVTGHTEAYS